MGNVTMATQPGLIRQAAAVAMRDGQVCLVSSRNGKRWVVPKGCMEPGKTAGEIALQEAWEEAGLVGLLYPEPIGSYVYDKDGFVCHVIVFRMDVTDQRDNYPEAGMRQRLWLPLLQAVTRIEDASLRDLIRGAVTSRAG
jgi:8-oxo-dGTP pyrophosphatase MutT (NUDIX family)